MKIFLLLFALSLTTIVYGQPGNGRNRTDTVCPTVENYKNLVIKAEQGKVLGERLIIATERLSVKDSIIRQLNVKDSVTRLDHKSELATKDDQNKKALEVVADLNKKLRWEKTKREIITGGAIAAIVYGIIKSSK